MSVVDSDYEKLRRYNLSELLHSGERRCKKSVKRGPHNQAVKFASNVPEQCKPSDEKTDYWAEQKSATEDATKQVTLP